MTVPPDNPGGAVPPGTVQELILSEERLQVSTVAVPARRVRLEKYVVTETRTITVQVSREQLRLVEVDLDSDDATADERADSVVDVTDSGRWLTLSEERIAITTEVVPVERVRLAVTSVVEHRAVTQDTRREKTVFDPGPNLAGSLPGIETFTQSPTHTEDSA